jgi:hypothetical protein
VTDFIWAKKTWSFGRGQVSMALPTEQVQGARFKVQGKKEN